MKAFTDPAIDAYLCNLYTWPDPVHAEMRTHADLHGFPIVGPLVGRTLMLLAQTVGARAVFELGSGFGYSAYWFAQGMRKNGSIVQTERSPANIERARHWLGQAGLGAMMTFEEGDALAAFTRHSGPFDIVFCDVDKHEYPLVPDLAHARLRPGGLLIFDNALWSGRVTEIPPPDATTGAIQRLNIGLANDPRFTTTILPIRDGVSVSVKL